MVASNKKNIVFRVDASTQMGAGHVMRCLTLADALKHQGAKCYFICREHPGNFIVNIREHGHVAFSLPYLGGFQSCNQDHPSDKLVHSAWLGTAQENDADLCVPIVKRLKPDWIIIDHYAIDNRWEMKLRKYCKHMMVIDDLADRYHNCDLLLDQTFDRDSNSYVPLVPSYCKLFCGAQFALLRPEFAQWRDYSLKRRLNKPIEHLLINLGGVDKDNITTKVLKNLTSSPLSVDCRITVVMGVTAPWVLEVQKQAEIMPWETNVKIGVNNMAEIMANSDLAIGAAGSTSWERCCLGLPTIMVVLADNQRLIASKLKGAGAALCIETEQINSQMLFSFIDKLVSSPDSLNKLGSFAGKIVNGAGINAVLRGLDS